MICDCVTFSKQTNSKKWTKSYQLFKHHT